MVTPTFTLGDRTFSGLSGRQMRMPPLTRPGSASLESGIRRVEPVIGYWVRFVCEEPVYTDMLTVDEADVNLIRRFGLTRERSGVSIPVMKCSIQGATGSWCQIPGLRDAFAELGHEHTDDWRGADSAFTFVGNPWFDAYLDSDKKLIFNVLDIPTHLSEVGDIIARLKTQLPRASKITCISRFVQSQLKTLCDIDAEVIYYPMKPVVPTGKRYYPEAKVLLVGRVNDPNKRVASAISVLIKAGYNENEIAVVGNENPHYGVYHGLVSDTKLNDLYNSVDYVMMLSRVEGIGLPAIEAACAGAIPIVAPDLTTFGEFWAASPMINIYSTFTSIDKIAQFMRYANNNPVEKAAMKAAMLDYANSHLRPLFDRVAVARRIISVYESI